MSESEQKQEHEDFETKMYAPLTRDQVAAAGLFDPSVRAQRIVELMDDPRMAALVYEMLNDAMTAKAHGAEFQGANEFMGALRLIVEQARLLLEPPKVKSSTPPSKRYIDGARALWKQFGKGIGFASEKEAAEVRNHYRELQEKEQAVVEGQ